MIFLSPTKQFLEEVLAIIRHSLTVGWDARNKLTNQTTMKQTQDRENKVKR